jgi:hypothetical protein
MAWRLNHQHNWNHSRSRGDIRDMAIFFYSWFRDLYTSRDLKKWSDILGAEMLVSVFWCLTLRYLLLKMMDKKLLPTQDSDSDCLFYCWNSWFYMAKSFTKGTREKRLTSVIFIKYLVYKNCKRGVSWQLTLGWLGYSKTISRVLFLINRNLWGITIRGELQYHQTE